MDKGPFKKNIFTKKSLIISEDLKDIFENFFKIFVQGVLGKILRIIEK